MRILIIDDDAAIRLLASAALEQTDGFKVFSARDGREGIALARTRTFDLILLDQLMPDMPGTAVLKELRHNPSASRSPIAFFTATTRDEDVADLYALGAIDVIGKPFDPDGLVARVTQILKDSGKLDPAIVPESTSLNERLTGEFLVDGLHEARELLTMVDNPDTFEPTAAAHIVHRWIGHGGTFGYPNITALGRQIDGDIESFPRHRPRLRSNLRVIGQLFEAGPPVGEDDEVFEGIGRPPTNDMIGQVKAVLMQNRIAWVGFNHDDSRRLESIFSAASARQARELTQRSDLSDPAELEGIDLVLQRVHAGQPAEHLETSRGHRPTLYVGPPHAMSPQVGLARGNDVAVCPVTPEELLLRTYRLLLADGQNGTRGTSSDNRLVVIADDDRALAALLEQTLTEWQFKCHLVESGSDALAACRRDGPAAVILDVNMPGMNGFEVLSQLKSDDATQSIPVVMATVRTEESDVLRGFALGAADYVAKPFSPVEVAARIQRILDGDRPVAA